MDYRCASHKRKIADDESFAVESRSPTLALTSKVDSLGALKRRLAREAEVDFENEQ